MDSMFELGKSVSSDESTSFDPYIAKLKKTLLVKQNLLCQLERQEKDFLGRGKLNEGTNTIARVEFTATAKNDYYLIPGRAETLITAGSKFTVFGQLGNGRWRCLVDREGERRITSSSDNCEKTNCASDKNNKLSFSHCDAEHTVGNSYPLIGSVATSAIAELAQPIRSAKRTINNVSILPCETNKVKDAVHSESPLSGYTNVSNSTTTLRSTTPSKFSTSRGSSSSRGQVSVKNLDQLFRACRVIVPPETPPESPTLLQSYNSFQFLPYTPTKSAMADLNQALESLRLSLFTPRSRHSSKCRSPSAASE